MNNTALQPQIQEHRPDLEWLLDPQPKTYRVRGYYNGEHLDYLESDDIRACERMVEALNTPNERWTTEDGRHLHSHFGCEVNKVDYKIEFIKAPTDEELLEEFADTNLFG